MDSTELSLQLKKPTGQNGREVAVMLNESNRELYELAFEMIGPDPGKTILEIGFGNGKHFPMYSALFDGITLTGVDFSRDMCNEAILHNQTLIESGQLEIHCADTETLPFPDRMFDTVMGLNLIYFLDPPATHLTGIRRVIKPGGHFLIGFRPRHSVEHLEFTRQNFILYELDELISLSEECGFKTVRHHTRTYAKKIPDGTISDITDCCLLLQNS